MSITKSRLNQIIKEEIERVTEGYGSSGWGGRGGRYTGGDTTGYKGSYNDTPWYRHAGTGRMSDAEARERGGRGYDEPYEDEPPRGRRGGIVSSTVSIHTSPSDAAKMDKNLAASLDSAANVFLGMTGYDGMAGKLILGLNPTTGFNDVGPRWVLSKAADGGYTFTVGGVIGTGATPSEALGDAAMQGFEGSDVVLNSLGMSVMSGDMGPMDEGDAEDEQMNESARNVTRRWNKLAGLLKEGSPQNLREMRFPWEDAPKKYADTPFSRYLESAAAMLKSDMIARATDQGDFDPDNLNVVVGPDSVTDDLGTKSRMGPSYGGMILRVYFASGSFSVVSGWSTVRDTRTPGVFNSEQALVDAVNSALVKAANGGPAPTVKEADTLQVGHDPDYGNTFGWQFTLNPPAGK